jgi:methylisocitrate lyase
MDSPGKKFRLTLQNESPLQIVGTINPLCALLAQQAGFRAIYLSGAGVANASFGLPDLGLTSLTEVLEDVRRITAVCPLPLLVDVDTGFGTALGIQRTTRELIRAGAAAMHLEDQVAAKRCGHRPGKQLVETTEMVDRLQAACQAKTDSEFFVIARTDAVASEGIAAAIERAVAYVQAGADGIFAEAITSAEDYLRFTQAVNVPVLANMTEFGKTPLMHLDMLKASGIAMVLYPLSAFRAMNRAASNVYASIREAGTQAGLLESMQTRDELYELLGYHQAEQQVDAILKANESKSDE